MTHSPESRSGPQAGCQRILQKQRSPSGAALQAQIAAATAVAARTAARTARFALVLNDPNSFNPATVISFQLAVNSCATVKVFAVNGREVTTLEPRELSGSQQAVTFAPRDLPGGDYSCKRTDQRFSQTRNVIRL